MKGFTLKKGIVILAVVAMTGFVATAFAGWGGGYGPRGGGWHHMGWGGPGHHMGWGGPDYDDYPNLTDEQQKAFEAERQAFFKDTESLRQDLYAKNLELRSELAKDNPDAQKAATIQKEVSKLESELDQKQLDHVMKMRKIAPEAGRGFMMGGRGPMRGYGPGPGRGYGGGYCWE